MQSRQNFIASVVVPAHNEAAVIGRLLDALGPLIRSGKLDVVVACNGCTDDTAQIAERHGARVVHTDVSSKIAALNAGDEAARAFPRLYVDADVVVDEATLLELIAALSSGETLCAAPPFVVDLSGRPWTVRAYYSVWLRDPYLTDGYVGSGIYALSAEGRARFGRFPNVIADDLYIHNLYRRSERRVAGSRPFMIKAPRTLASLYRRRIRITRGNLEIAKHPEYSRLPGSDERSRPWWTAVLSRPWLIPSAILFAAVNLLARVQATRQFRERARMDWARDETIRT